MSANEMLISAAIIELVEEDLAYALRELKKSAGTAGVSRRELLSRVRNAIAEADLRLEIVEERDE